MALAHLRWQLQPLQRRPRYVAEDRDIQDNGIGRLTGPDVAVNFRCRERTIEYRGVGLAEHYPHIDWQRPRIGDVFDSKARHDLREALVERREFKRYLGFGHQQAVGRLVRQIDVVSG